MGLLTRGEPLEWSELCQYSDVIKERGIKGFLKIYQQYKDHEHDALKWGDEIEFNLVRFDHQNKKVCLLLKASKLLPILQEAEKHQNIKTHWCPEFADYMIEGTPANPMGDNISDFAKLEGNMRLRRQQINDLLDKDEYCSSLATFPLLGCQNFTYPSYQVNIPQPITQSCFIPDETIYKLHPRFTSVAENIRKRRGSKVIVYVPIFVDKCTPRPFNEDLSYLMNNADTAKLEDDHIYLDATGFGMGCSSLQTTFQAQNLNEARHLYDQLAALTPILLSLSAASPIWRGYLSDIDTRWYVVSASVDDRTPEEMGEVNLEKNKYRIYKSRYDTIDCFLSPEGSRYSDKKLVMNKEAYKTLIDNNVDDILARHISHLFVRDSLCLYREKIEDETDCFENIQSTNWQSMRFKPPPYYSPIGWRVEFRTMDLQLTDFENAAFVTFLVLFTRVILSFKLNLLIPVSKIDENMKIAQQRDACREGKFYFRKCLFNLASMNKAEYKSKHDKKSCNDEDEENIHSVYTLMSVNEIINGNSENNFPGLVPLIRDYLTNFSIDIETLEKLNSYLNLISGRANGELLTAASYMRKIVSEHPKYKFDSIVSEEIAYDLLWRIQLIASGEIKCPEMFYEQLGK